VDRRSTYWDEVAEEYDGLYVNDWSALEDRFVAERLASIWPEPGGVHLDLGSGTGLARRLSPIGHHYVALDISAGMLLRHPSNSMRVQCDLDSGLPIRSQSCSVVTALFAASSYLANLDLLLTEVARVLPPDRGVAYLSFLSRRSFRRVVHREREEAERYRTRNGSSTAVAPVARVYRFRDIAMAADRADLQLVEHHGLGTLSGVLERPGLFRASQMLARVSPERAHLLEVVLRPRSSIS